MAHFNIANIEIIPRNFRPICMSSPPNKTNGKIKRRDVRDSDRDLAVINTQENKQDKGY